MASQYPRSTPIIGNWYQSTEQNLYFEVVAVDGLSNSIEVQLLDGEIMEFDTDSWHEAVITSAQPPEDASAAYEMSSEDLRMNDYITSENSFNNPLASIEPEQFPDIEDF